jgi:hypothetical protein
MRYGALVALFVVGCGSASFEVAEPTADTAFALDDSSAAVDSDNDTGATDSTVGETTPPPDTTVVDTATMLDTRAETVVDTAVADSVVAETILPDVVTVDAVDSTPVCTATGPEVCNGIDDDCNGVVDDGIPVTPCGVGACRVTPAAACSGGKLATCTPGTAGTSDTTCDGIDDDCNGVVDDGCITCARYVLLGATGGTGLTAASPLGSIQAAITSLAGATGKVCVAANAPGGTCTATVYNERVNMAEGASVFGGFKPGTTWTRGDPTCVTTITDPPTASPAGLGVYFTHTITNATQLDGFTINGATFTSAFTTSVGVTIQGGGTVTNNIINGSTGGASYGMQLTATASATLPAPVIMFNAISGGTSGGGITTANSVGIRINNLAPVIRNNRSITAGAASNNSRGIEITGSGRGTVIADNTTISGGSGNLSVGIDGTGDISGVVITRNTTISSGYGNTQARAISMLGCSTSSGRAYVVGNDTISATGSASAQTYGLTIQNSAASCAVLIDGNSKIVGKTTNGSQAQGIYCLSAGTTCTVANNAFIAGFDAANGSTGRAVYFQASAGGSIVRNTLVGCASAGSSLGGCSGVYLESASATTVSGNVFNANRGNYSAGLRSRWTNATITNNLVYVEANSGIEIDVRPPTMGSYEATVHSNTLIAPTTPAGTPPQVQLLAVDNEAPSGSPSGIFRNNLAVCQGTGVNRWAFREFGAFAEPRILENNDFYGCNTLYGDNETGPVTSIALVNGFADIPTKGLNISVDPMFVTGGWHLSSTSPIIDLGTSAQCPAYDYDGDRRPARLACDIGADEVP